MSLARQQLLGVAAAGQQSQLSSHPISPSTGASFINQQLESLSAEQLEALLEDEEAFRQFMIKHVSETQAAKTLQDIASRNRALAQENLDMQASIQEARNHVAVVKSSEFTGARNSFAELQARQAAVTDTLGSQALMALLVKEVDKLDAKSGALHDAFLTGELTADAFVEQYLVQRTAYHNLDIKRQVAEYSLS